MSATPAEQLAHLEAIEPRIGALASRVGLPPKRRPAPVASRFDLLATAILHQQLAGAAARAICSRVTAVAGGPLTAEVVAQLDEEEIRACGVSGAKWASLADLADACRTGRVQLASMGRLSDEVVIDQLVTVRGIGRWTAQMFLMSGLGRLDVWPSGDFGVRAGWGALTATAMVTPKVLEGVGDPFRPYRSALAWYCWQAAGEAKGA